MNAGLRRAAAGIAAALAALGVASFAHASPPPVVVENGVTQPVFGYADAVRERLWVESPFDSDANGVLDLIAIDIKRPAATELGLEVPVIMDAEPVLLDPRARKRVRAQARRRRRRPARPVASVLRQLLRPARLRRGPHGHGRDEQLDGLPDRDGVSDNLSAKIVIDWLNGRATARDKDGNIVEADWHTGKTGHDRQVLRRHARQRGRGRRASRASRRSSRSPRSPATTTTRARTASSSAEQLPGQPGQHGDQPRAA